MFSQVGKFWVKVVHGENDDHVIARVASTARRRVIPPARRTDQTLSVSFYCSACATIERDGGHLVPM